MAATPDVIDKMRERRAAGESVRALAGELGIPWQRLEKLTRPESWSVPADRNSILNELRQIRLLLASVPDLGSCQPWALAWRRRICQRFRARIAYLRRRLAVVNRSFQVSANESRLWAPRVSTAADVRMRRLFDPRGTGELWAGATRKE